MKIRTRLSIQFLGIVTTLITISLLLIYFLSAEYRSRDFFTRLRNKALTTARLVVQVDEINNQLMKIIDKNETSILFNKNVVIYDTKNKEIYRSNSNPGVQLSPFLLNRIRTKGEITFYEGESQVLGRVFIDKKDRFVIVASGLDILGYEKLQNLKLILIIVFFSNILFVSVAGYIFAGRALAPISNVIKEVDNISAKNLSQRVNEGNGKDEIALLAKTFNNMLKRIEQAFEKQKAFVANASHELRNPLTAISGQLEVALLKKRTEEEYERVLSSIFEDIKNLSALSNRLLSLAQTTSNNQNFHFSTVRIDELLWKAREELLLGNPEYTVSIEFPGESDDESQLVISGNDTLLKIAFSNIMDNGCKFSDDKKVAVKLKLEKDLIVLNFIDKGVWIRPEEQKNIFEPFYRSSKTNNIKGHGVGLALVDRIIQLHTGSIQITSDPALTIFTISLPRRIV